MSLFPTITNVALYPLKHFVLRMHISRLTKEENVVGANQKMIMQIFKLKESLGATVRGLRAEHYTEVECTVLGYRLFTLPRRTTPRWSDFVNSISSEPKDYTNISESFVLMREASNGTVFATTGGLGTHAIRTYVDPDFGLNLLSRLVDPNQITLLRQQPISGNVAQEERIFRNPAAYHGDPLDVLILARQ